MPRGRRRKNNDAEGVIWFIIILIFFGYFLIKWAIEALVFIIGGIIAICSSIAKHIKNKQEINKVTKVPFKETSFTNEKVNENFIKEKFNLVDMSQYDKLFENKIIPRGISYYNQDKITNVVENENKYTCIANGTKDYTVKLTFDTNDNTILKKASCTCPYFSENNANCKHIYAALLKVKCGDSIKTLIEESNNTIEAIKTMLNNAEKYINNHRFENKYHNEFNSLKNDSLIKVNSFSSRIKYAKSQDIIIDILQEELDLKVQLQKKIKKILDNETTGTTYSSNNYSSKNENNGSSLGTALAGIAIADAISNHKKEKEEQERLEEEREELRSVWGLDEHEIDAVQSGDYEPYNFEEEELEEDDYYYEDDI